MKMALYLCYDPNRKTQKEKRGLSGGKYLWLGVIHISADAPRGEGLSQSVIMVSAGGGLATMSADNLGIL